MTTIDEFRARLDIREVAERLTGEPVSPAPGGGKIRCPVHDEDSPSCYLYGSDNHYHCFGCGAHGSVFDLVSAVRGIGFGESLNWLAETFGLEAPARDPRAAARSAALRALREACADPDPAARFGLPEARAKELGLGRARDLPALRAARDLVPLTVAEAALFEGHPTIELGGRGGVAAVGALLEIDGELRLRKPANLRFPLFALLAGSRSAIGAAGRVVATRHIADALALQADGVETAVSAGAPLDADHAGELGAVSRHLILALRPGDDVLGEIAAAWGAGLRVSIAPLRDGALGAAIPASRYCAELLRRDTARRDAVAAAIAAAPSPSTRAILASVALA